MSSEENTSSSSYLVITGMEKVAEHDTDGIISTVVLPEPQPENFIISPVVLPEPQQENQEVEESSKPSQGKKKKLKKIWLALPLLGAILAISGVLFMRQGNNAEKTPTAAVEYSPLPVRVTTAQSKPISAWVSTEGTVQAKQFRYLAFDVAGDVTYIAKQNGRGLREGDKVTKGELLAQIDDREELANVSKAEAAIAEAQKRKAAAAADVASAQSQVAQARSQVQQLQAQVTKAQSKRNLEQTQLQRYQFLFKEGAVASNEIDTRTNAVRDAEADIRAASAQVASAQSQIASAQSQVIAAQQQLQATESSITTANAQLTQAKVALEGTKLYAPFTGIVAYLNIREGEYYTPQSVSSQIGGDLQGINERIPIVVIDPTQFEVVVDLPAESGERVQNGQTAVVSSSDINANNNQTLIESARARGQVIAVNPAVSPGGRSIQATIRLNSGTAKLQHGERVTTWVAVDEKQNAVVAPLNAFVFRNQKPYVFVVNPEKGVVEQRQIEPGIEGITQREILKGVSAGEKLVTEGQNRLVDQTPVKVINNKEVK
ncbi:MAG: HlyD family efflux transporter periplasmic adaptor subunit [Coleofasciculaceae cyanobacterium]